MRVRLKFKQDVAISVESSKAPLAFPAKTALKPGFAVEDSSSDDRMLPTFFWSLSDLPGDGRI